MKIKLIEIVGNMVVYLFKLLCPSIFRTVCHLD